jgi:hypothetical protein
MIFHTCIMNQDTIASMCYRGGTGPGDILCKPRRVLVCVLELPRVDNSSTGLLKSGAHLGGICLHWLKSGHVFYMISTIFAINRCIA